MSTSVNDRIEQGLGVSKLEDKGLNESTKAGQATVCGFLVSGFLGCSAIN